jgi:hypothetical protein
MSDLIMKPAEYDMGEGLPAVLKLSKSNITGLSKTQLNDEIKKATTLITHIQSKIAMCDIKKQETTSSIAKQTCDAQRSLHSQNITTLYGNMRVMELGVTPTRAGSRRKTLKGRRKQNKSRRNRKSRR